MNTTSWTTVNADSSTSAASAASHTSEHSINSTPRKTRLVSHRYTHHSVDDDFRKELQRYQYSGITFEDFLMCSFHVSAEELDALKKSVMDASIHTSPEYTKEQASFSHFAEKEETAMYKPFAQMSNMVLNHHQTGSERKIKVLDYDGSTKVKSRFATRKPDVVIVPDKDGDTELTKLNALWRHMLCVLEFKKDSKSTKNAATKESSIGKREREEQVDEAGGSAPKRRTPNNSETRTSLGATRAPGNATASSSNVTLESEAINETPSSTTPSNTLRSGQSSRGKSKGKRTQKPKSNSGNPGFTQRRSGNSHSSASREIMGPPAIGMQADPFLQSPPLMEDIAPAERRPAIPLRRTSAMTTSVQVPSESRNHAEGTVDGLQVQLANYITEVMSDRSDRVFAFGATVKDTQMRMTYHSRSMYAISDPIDIVQNPVLFSVFLLLFAKQTPEKLGFNTDVDFCDPFITKEKEPTELNLKLDAIEGGDNFRLRPDTILRLGRCIHTEYCLIGRATAVYEVVRPEGCDIDLVVKFSWQVKTRRREDKAILIARSVDPEHSPEIYGVAVLDERSPSVAFKGRCETHPSRPSEERELRILLMRKYEDIEDLDDAEFLKIIPQFVSYVHDLYSKRDLLHRDISIFNMAYYVKDDRKIATLIDFDLATFPDDDSTAGNSSNLPVASASGQQPGEDRSGTTPFMAIESLDLASPGYKHHVSHELESIFYCMVWHGVGYRYKRGIYPTEDNRHNKDRRNDDLLQGWRIGSWKKVLDEKVKFFANTAKILSFIFLDEFCETALNLGDFMEDRQVAFADQNKANLRLRVKSTVILPSKKPNKAIFPEFARVLQLGASGCSKDCCVAQ